MNPNDGSAGKPAHDLQAKTLTVFDYEDEKDKESEELDK